MTARLLLFLALVLATSIAQAAEPYRMLYLQRADDPFYAQRKAYTGLTLRQRHRPLDGALTAIKESRIQLRRLGLTPEIDVKELAKGEGALQALEAHLAAGGAGAILLDLPLDETLALAEKWAEHAAGRDLMLFNPRHPDDALRTDACALGLLHTIPSRAMLADALAQHLSAKDWRRVLVLQGPTALDLLTVAAFKRAAARYGLEITAIEPFVLGNDPRQRDQNNVALMTAQSDYDTVLVADEEGEVARYVPYATQLPRPVIGSAGLIADAWHWTWERHGAPQLNQRFDKQAHRRMTSLDLAAWAAVKAVVEAIVRTNATDTPTLRAYLMSDALALDTYLGAPGTFRPWSGQLRLPILLHTDDAVIARAPLAPFLHARNQLDTLGFDLGETACAG